VGRSRPSPLSSPARRRQEPHRPPGATGPSRCTGARCRRLSRSKTQAGGKRGKRGSTVCAGGGPSRPSRRSVRWPRFCSCVARSSARRPDRSAKRRPSDSAGRPRPRLRLASRPRPEGALDRDAVIPMPADGSEPARPHSQRERRQGPVRGAHEPRLQPPPSSTLRSGPGPTVNGRQVYGILEELGSGASAKSASEPAESALNGPPRLKASSGAAGASIRKKDGNTDEVLGELGRSSDHRTPARAAGPDPAAGSATRRRSAAGGAARDDRAALDVEPSGGSPTARAVTVAPEADRQQEAEASSREDSARFAQPPPAPPRPARLAPAPAVRQAAAPAPPPAPTTASPSKPSPAPSSARSGPPAPAAAAESPRAASAPAASAGSAPVLDDHVLGAGKKAKNRSADKSKAAADEVDERAAPPAAGRSVDPAVALSDRAAKLLAARRFSEASAAYRDLLRRFPKHPSAPLWRARLAASDAAGGSDTSGFAAPPAPK
jgi:hypothetical protein